MSGDQRTMLANGLAVGSPILAGLITSAVVTAFEKNWLPALPPFAIVDLPPFAIVDEFVLVANAVLATIGSGAAGFISPGTLRYRVVITIGTAMFGFVAYHFVLCGFGFYQ